MSTKNISSELLKQNDTEQSEKDESYKKIVTIEKNILEIVPKFVDISKQVQEITHFPKEHHENALRDLEMQSKACSVRWMRSLESLDGIKLDDTQTVSKSKRKSVVDCANSYMDQADELIQQIKTIKRNILCDVEKGESYQKIVAIEKNILKMAQKFGDIFKQVQEITHLPKEHHETALRDLEKQSKAFFEKSKHYLESLDSIQLDDIQVVSKSKHKSVVNCANSYMYQADSLIQQIKTLVNKISTEKQNLESNQGLTRLEIIKYLIQNDIKPNSKDYSTHFVEYIYSKLHISKSELPDQISQDIYKINTYWKNCHRNAELFYERHSKFLSVKVKPKRCAPVSPQSISETDSVCFNLPHF